MITLKEVSISTMIEPSPYLKIHMEGLRIAGKKEVFKLLRHYLRKSLECIVNKILVEIHSHYLTGNPPIKKVTEKS